MKKLFLIVCTLSLVFGIVGGAGAAPYTFDMGANSSIDVIGTSSALEMYAIINPLDDIWYTLDEGASYSFLFATIRTDEEWINEDDLDPGAITAWVDFDNPDITQDVGGTSIGFRGTFGGFNQGWNITWADPVIVNFGSGGQFQIELSDVGYESCWWQGPDGSADVYAKVTLLASPAENDPGTNPVPEPATILLLGFGLLGLGLARRKS